MSTKPQSPGPSTTATPRKARTIKQEEGSSSARAGSAGGIVLPKEQKSNKMASVTPKKVATPPPAKDEGTSSAQTGPNRQRRKPRKLNKDPAPEPPAKDSPSTIPAITPSGDTVAVTSLYGVPAASTELEALKSRVRGLEAKVEELTSSVRNRSPRRRGKGRKNSTPQVPTTAPAESPRVQEVEDEEEADEELERAEEELEAARQDLALYRPRNRPRGKRTKSEETEYVEEIPRDGVGVEEMIDNEGRQVTLSGSYRIPLPATVSMDDVKTIQSGVSAAQNVARSFLEQRRARQAMQAQEEPPKPKSKPAATPKSNTKKAATQSSTAVAKSAEGEKKQGWGEWFGGYSMAVSRAVKNIEAEAAIESQNQRAGSTGTRKPAAARTASAQSTKTAGTAKLKASAGTAKAAQRPKARSANLSSEQVQGLMK